MGGSNYSSTDHSARSAYRKATGAPTFAHSAAVAAGRVAKAVHKDLDPKETFRVSRDSDLHPVTVPIMVIMDTTGSMQRVPEILEAKLSNLMGVFLNDKASGKKYLGEGYPAILIGAVDDYDAQKSYLNNDGNGAF